MDWPQGFLRGGETKVLSMVLNIQEGVYTPQELVCGVLVLRLEDSRQDLFFCLAASLMPSLLGAELQPLALLGEQTLLPACVSASAAAAAAAETHAPPAAAASEAAAVGAAAAAASTPSEDMHSTLKGDKDLQQKKQKNNEHTPEHAENKSAMLPLPKELWWLLSHLHSQSQAAASAAAAAGGPLPGQRSRSRRKRGDKSCGGGLQPSLGQHQGALVPDSSSSSSSNSSSDSSSSTSESSSDSEDSYLSEDNSCCSSIWEQQQGLLGPQSGEVNLKRDIALFLSAAGGDSFTWPSFLAGADACMQHQKVSLDTPAASGASAPAAASGVDGDSAPSQRSSSKLSSSSSSSKWSSSSSSSSSRMRSGGGEENDSLMRESHKHCPFCCRGPLEREVVFLKACIERGIEVPSGVSVGATMAVSAAAADAPLDAAAASASAAAAALLHSHEAICEAPAASTARHSSSS